MSIYEIRFKIYKDSMNSCQLPNKVFYYSLTLISNGKWECASDGVPILNFSPRTQEGC